MDIRTNTMFGTSHSWAVTMRSLFSEFIKENHRPFIMSINGYKGVNPKWKFAFDQDTKYPDLDICYTAPLNFKTRFQKKAKIKAAIYNYETKPFPKEWFGCWDDLDFILPSSQWSKEVFLEAGCPDEKLKVIPHGIDILSKTKTKFKLNSDKSFKFLAVCIPHKRKNIDILIDAYYSSFTSNDDICLVIKTELKDKVSQRFEVNVIEEIKKMQVKHLARGHTSKSLPQVEIVSSFIDNMWELYNSVDAIVSATSSEGFGIPFLEGLAAEKIVIAPACTGQLDFLNNKNSLLVECREIVATPAYQYWYVSDNAKTFVPKFDDLVENMIYAYKNNVKCKTELLPEMARTAKLYSWKAAADGILKLK
jgi:glycosyltransferase involved in cell wall biosynthesis